MHFSRLAVRASLVLSLAFWLALRPSWSLAQTDSNSRIASSSLARVPSSLDYYAGSFQLRSQWEQLLSSPFAERVRATSLYAKFQKEILAAWQERRGEFARIRAVIENPIAIDGIQFLKDILSEDVFVLADDSLSDSLRRLSVVQKKAHLLVDERATNDEKAEIVYEWIDQLLPDFRFPTLLLGARFSDRDRALAKVDEIEGLLRFGIGSQPGAAEAIKLLQRIDDARGTRLRWRLSGDKIPWDFLPTNEIFDRESLDRLRELISEKSLSVSLGILDDYFVFAVSGRDELPLATIYEDSLLQHSDLQLVRDHAHQKITSASYVSDKLANAWFELTLEDFFLQIARRSILPVIERQERDSEFRDWLVSIIDDCGWLDTTIGKHVPVPRGSSQVSFLNEQGWETHQHERTKDVLFDGSQPLRGLQHIGPAPLLVLNVRLAEHPEYFQAARAIVKRIRLRIDELVTMDPKDLPGDWSQSSIRDVLAYWPILTQFADAWEAGFLPAMDGEHAVVLHTGFLNSQQWHPSLPISDFPLSIPEVAILTGIRDQQNWIDALGSLRKPIENWFEILRTRNPDAMDYKIPKYLTYQTKGIVVYGYPIPDSCPAPKEMMPLLSIGDGWSIASYSYQQTAAIRETRPSVIGGGLLAPNVPLAKAAYIDVSGIARMLTPWIRHGLLQIQTDLNQPLPRPNDNTTLDVAITGADLLEAWSVLESIGYLASATWREADGGSRSRSVFTVPR